MEGTLGVVELGGSPYSALLGNTPTRHRQSAELGNIRRYYARAP